MYSDSSGRAESAKPQTIRKLVQESGSQLRVKNARCNEDVVVESAEL